MMRILWVALAVAGVWLIASSATENGLLPSGHGTGWVSELLLGIAAVAYSLYRLRWK
jgi:hypothetical protein